MTDVVGSIDTSVLLRLILGDVPKQLHAAQALLERGTAHVSDLAVAEVVFVLGREYRLDRKQQAAAVLTVLALPAVQSSRQVIEAALVTYVDHPKLSFEDCLLVSRAERDDTGPLWTFDRMLASQTSAELVPPAP